MYSEKDFSRTFQLRMLNDDEEILLNNRNNVFMETFPTWLNKGWLYEIDIAESSKYALSYCSEDSTTLKNDGWRLRLLRRLQSGEFNESLILKRTIKSFHKLNDYFNETV